jgi:hypothetical protein
MNLIMEHLCECGNNADNYLANETPLNGYPPKCGECAHAEDCKPKKKMRFYSAHFGGHGVASCKNCTFTAVYFECGCDLLHNCNEYK